MIPLAAAAAISLWVISAPTATVPLLPQDIIGDVDLDTGTLTATVSVISLWVNACISGTLHGEPKDLCRELQIRGYDTVAACEKARPAATFEWLRGLDVYRLPLHIVGSRCGAAEAEGDDP